MQGKTRVYKPELELGIEKVTRWKKLAKINGIVEKVEVRLECCLNVEPIVSPLL
jgi:hypothetical protein